MPSTRRTHGRPHQPSRVLAATAALALGAGLGLAPALGAVAAPGDESHASASVVAGSLLSGLPPATLALLGSAEASNDGTQPTQLEQNPLDATVLQALTIDLGGGVQVPLTLGDVGALQSYARAEADGTSVAGAGLVGSDGAVGVGEPGAGAPPAALTVDLTDVLSEAVATELLDIDLVLGAVSGGATSVAGGTPVGDYEILGGDLLITSSALAGTAGLLDAAVADIEAAVTGLTGPTGTLVTDIAAIADPLGVVGIGADADATITVDLSTALDTLDLSARSLGPVTIDPLSGLITVDLDALNGGSLNGLAPNTNILTPGQLTAVVGAVETLLDGIVADAAALIAPVLDAATVAIDLDLDLLGVPLAAITVDGTLAELADGLGTVDVTALGLVELGPLTEAAVAGTVGDLLEPLADGALPILDLGVVGEILDGLDPAFDALPGVLLLTVNNQEPSPAVAGEVFTETAFRLSLLPQGAIPALLTLDLGQASVGPNLVDVAPTIAGIDPTTGPETGGTPVTITGTGMVGSTGVTFDGIPGTAFTVVSDTEISVITPPHAPATVDVVVLHPSGPSLPGEFTYTPIASITDIDPGFGPEAGGTIVEITGTCFTGATGVFFGGAPAADFTVNGATSITATTPPGVGVVDVVVTGAPECGSATAPGGFTYVAPGAPTITAITPDTGPEDGGTPVTITGDGFTGATGVTFDGVPATDVVVVDDETITAVSPPGAPGLADVVVVMPGPDSGPVYFTYFALIAVGDVEPGFGPAAGGTIVEITGTCFTGATGVTFDGVPAASFVVNSDTSITATTPPGTPGFADVVVVGTAECGGPAELEDGFEYIDEDAPVIASLSPDNGPQTGGTVVTISGVGFTGATGVTFDGAAGTAFTVVDDATITVTSPAGEVGPADVRVLHPAGASAPLTFTYLPATTVGEVIPGSGPEEGGTLVTINGSCFTGATAVTFGGVPAAEFTVLSDAVISAVTPPGVGAVDVVVTGTALCGTGTLVDGFTYVDAGSGSGGGALADTGSSPAPMLMVVVALLGLGSLMFAARRRGSLA